MSDANSNIGRNAASRKPSSARSRHFAEAGANVKANSVPTLEAILLLVPTEDRLARIVSHFGIEAGDVDELVGAGSSVIRDQYELMAPILSFEGRDGTNYTGLKLHLDRIVDAFIRSAYGAANFYETRRQAAKDANNAFANEHRDEDRMGIDGGPNRAEHLMRIAAENGAKAWALASQAQGACAAYKELMGSDWQPYQPANRRSLSEQAAAASPNRPPPLRPTPSVSDPARRTRKGPVSVPSQGNAPDHATPLV